jgi:integrase
MMSANPLSWSEERQQSLREYPQGRFASDAWRVGPTHKPEKQSTLDFSPLQSSALKIELKYAVWCKFQRKEWNLEGGKHDSNRRSLRLVITWLNRVAPGGQSLLEKSLAQWELSLRTFLIETGQFRVDRPSNKYVNAQQVLVCHERRENEVVRWFRHMYKIVAGAYDDRPEVEKDIWDMHKMRMEVNPASTSHRLNFTRISQPWLRDLAKEYMRYNVAVHSPGDCLKKLNALNSFSRFLASAHPHLSISELNRALIVEYIGHLRESPVSEAWECQVLVALRTILETSAYRLDRHDLPKERLIFDDDLPKEKKTLPREIPEEVLAQIREHLETLDTVMLRMVTILLECGLRISELCTLPFDCLICDDKHEWYLKFYQMKLKQEHVIPWSMKPLWPLSRRNKKTRARNGETRVLTCSLARSSELVGSHCLFSD